VSSVLTLLVVLSTGAVPDHKAEAVEAYRRKDYKTANRLLVPLAEAEDHEAAQKLADLYYGGHGVERDVRAAVHWYEKAAVSGDIIAIKNLGAIHMSDKEVLDLEKAEYWYKKAAATGDAESMGAMAFLALALHNDAKKSQEWSIKAAEAGFVEAMISVARGYFEGKGFPQDYERAHYWFNRLAEKDIAYGDNGLGMIYSKGLVGERDLPKALTHYQRAAAARLPVAQFNLGRMYMEGDGVEKDYELAVYWLGEAASRGEVHSILYIGNAYSNGFGVPRDDVRALTAYRISYSRIPTSELEHSIRSLEASLNPEELEEAKQLYEKIIGRELGMEAILPAARPPK